MANNLHPVLEEYVSRFQVSKPTQIEKEFYTQYDLSDYWKFLPYIFSIENFCLRLLLALKKDEKVCIYADFDTDAVTATGVMYWGLIDLGFKKEKLFFYTPDRFTEGYGVNLDAIKYLGNNFDLIITVDCGINSVEESAALLNSGCDLIITDHHHLAGEVPNCISVCNPRLSEYYKLNPQELSKLDSTKLKLIERLSTILDLQTIEKTQEWTDRLRTRFIKPDSNNYLSSSVTGVGVAWFTLVWFGYFLEEIELEKSELNS